MANCLEVEPLTILWFGVIPMLVTSIGNGAFAPSRHEIMVETWYVDIKRLEDLIAIVAAEVNKWSEVFTTEF